MVIQYIHTSKNNKNSLWKVSKRTKIHISEQGYGNLNDTRILESLVQSTSKTSMETFGNDITKKLLIDLFKFFWSYWYNKNNLAWSIGK